MTQQQIQKLLLPILSREGKRYQKFKKTLAKKVKKQQVVQTITADGLETTNVAEVGDFIVQNNTNAKEQYVVKPDKFTARYIWEKDLDNGFAEYRPIGEVQAIEITDTLLEQLGQESPFYFIAPWGSEMIAKKGDYLACSTDEIEIRRIAQQEFMETYRIMDLE